MPLHRIEVSGADRKTARLIRRCARAALRQQGIPFRALINVTVTDDEGIRELNRAHRNIDAPTDVLSFPLLDWTDGQGEAPQPYDFDPRTRCAALGDVVLSAQRARAQAEEFGHSFQRECGYLVVHSVLHLLGYDHVDEGPRKLLMRGFEEDIIRLALGKAGEREKTPETSEQRE